MNPLSPSSPAAPRVLILGAGFGTNNRGVAALACGALAAVFHASPRARVALLDYAREPVTHAFRHEGRVHRVPTVALRFSRNPLQRNHVARLLLTALFLRLWPERVRAAGLRHNPCLHAIAEADFIGALSGGDSFSSLYGLRRLLYVSLPQLLVLAVGRPLVLLPQSYGPFRTRASRVIARAIVTRASRLYFREAGGFASLARLAPGVRSRATFAPDLGLALEPHPAPPAVLAAVDGLARRQAGPVVGLNVSGLLAADPGAARSGFGLRDDYAAAMRELVIALVEWSGAAVVLIPHVFGQGGESDVSATTALWRTLPASTAGSVLAVTTALDQHEVKGLIRRCDVFVGARMHACIAALSQSVPTVALAYSDKFAGVLSALGAGDFVVDLRRTARNQVIAAVLRTVRERREIRARLEAYMPAIHASVLGFFGSLPGRHGAAPGPAPADPAVALSREGTAVP